MKRLYLALLWSAITIVCIGGSSGCSAPTSKKTNSAKEQKPDPLNQTVRVRQKDDDNPVNTKGKIVDKRLLQVVADGENIKVNGVEFNSIRELEKLFKNSDSPIITIATHKCMSTQEASKLLSTAQKYTLSPIAFKSFGNYDDPQCG